MTGGTNPFTWGGTCWADIKGGTGFGGSTALASGDFQAAADATQVASMSNPAADGDYSSGTLTSGLSYINKTGTTQFRVYFSVDDNDNMAQNYFDFYDGEDAGTDYQPRLSITYTTPMLAEGGEMIGREVADLSMSELRPVVAEVKADWLAAGAAGWQLRNVHFAIADLPGAMLGMAVGRTVYIDSNAAGYGWANDAAFAQGVDYSTERAGVGMDLLTVMSHELGHVLGLEHAAQGVMSETLAEGVRELPSINDLAGLTHRSRRDSAIYDLGFLSALEDLDHAHHGRHWTLTDV